MKKWIAACIAISTLFLCVFGGVGCDRDGQVTKAQVLEKSETFVAIQVTDYIGDATPYDALVYLRAEGLLEFESENSTYGQSLLSLNGKANPADWSYFWASYVCTQSMGNPDVIYMYNSATYYFANYGIDGVYLQKDGIYIWVYEKSAW